MKALIAYDEKDIRDSIAAYIAAEGGWRSPNKSRGRGYLPGLRLGR